MQHGEVIHPHQFAAKLQIAPYVYFIKPWEVAHKYTDAIYDTSYLGGTAVMLVNVPHALTEEDLRAWFRAGLVGGDVEVIAITKKIQRAERKLNSLRGNLRQMQQQLEDAGALQDDGTSAGGSATASTVSAAVIRAREAERGPDYGGAVVTGGGLSRPSTRGSGGAGGQARRRGGPDLSGLQEGVDRLRSMVQEWGGRTLPALLEARAELLDTAAAMDVRLLRVAEQSEWEAMAVARWSGADVTNQERRQRLRFGISLPSGADAEAKGKGRGRSKKARRRAKARANKAVLAGQGKFRAKVVGASGTPPTDEAADDEVEERLRTDPNFVGSVRMDGRGASSFGGGMGAMTADGFTTGRTGMPGGRGGRRPSSAGSGGSVYITGDDEDEDDDDGAVGRSSDDDSPSDDDFSDDDSDSDDDARTGITGAGRTTGGRSSASRASSKASKRKAARQFAEAADQDRRGVKRRHVWQLFLPSGELS
jgi:hypothetical protein